jgi:hypothetical protein
MKIGNPYSAKIEVPEGLPWPKEVPYLTESDIVRHTIGIHGADTPHCLLGWVRIVSHGEMKSGVRKRRKGVGLAEAVQMETLLVKALIKQMGIGHPNRRATLEFPSSNGELVRRANDNEENHKRSLAAAWNRAMHKDLGYTEFV